MKATVTVTLKPGVLDPQGKAITHGLHALGFDEVSGVRVGKVFEIELDHSDPERLKEMSAKLLANTVIEDFHIDAGDSA